MKQWFHGNSLRDHGELERGYVDFFYLPWHRLYLIEMNFFTSSIHAKAILLMARINTLSPKKMSRCAIKKNSDGWDEYVQVWVMFAIA